MKVKLSVSRAGLNFTQEKGDIVDVEADEAGRMFASGQCQFVNDDDKAVALKARDEWEAKRSASTASATAADVEDDDSDAINGDGAEAPPPEGNQTGLQKAKAKAKAKAD